MQFLGGGKEGSAGLVYVGDPFCWGRMVRGRGGTRGTGRWRDQNWPLLSETAVELVHGFYSKWRMEGN